MKPKKRFGQHFFTDPFFLMDCLDKMGLTSDDTVLEIGPGKGILTELLLEKVKKVIAIEIDHQLYDLLVEEFAYAENLKLVNADFMELDTAQLTELFGADKPKVVANIPYYITTPIIMKLLNEKSFKTEGLAPETCLFSDIFIMIQAEVAKRILALPTNKNFGKLSVSVQYASEPNLIEWIDKSYFHPVPKVDSAFIQLRPRIEAPIQLKSFQAFWSLVNTIYQSRRKTLKNSLKQMGLSIEELDALSQQFNLIARGETLGLEELAELANRIAVFR